MRKVSVLFPVVAFNRKSCSIHISDDKLDLTEKYSICNRYRRDRRITFEYLVRWFRTNSTEFDGIQTPLWENYKEEKDENLIHSTRTGGFGAYLKFYKKKRKKKNWIASMGKNVDCAESSLLTVFRLGASWCRPNSMDYVFIREKTFAT